MYMYVYMFTILSQMTSKYSQSGFSLGSYKVACWPPITPEYPLISHFFTLFCPLLENFLNQKFKLLGCLTEADIWLVDGLDTEDFEEQGVWLAEENANERVCWPLLSLGFFGINILVHVKSVCAVENTFWTN